MNVIFIEDNDVQRQATMRFICECMGDKAQISAYDSIKAYRASELCIAPNIAVLDIALLEESGISFAHELNSEAPHCQIIFLTGHIEFASEVYRTRHTWFVTKDKAQEMLPEALKKAEKEMLRLGSERLQLEQGDGTHFVAMSEVIYAERNKRRTKIVCSSREYCVADSIKTLLKQLNGSEFVQCHTSYIINIKNVQQLKRTEAWLDDDVCVPISRRYTNEVRAKFGTYINK